jgi:hypothetical protein
MQWKALKFGKHSGKTIPQILFTDPAYFYWAMENDVFYGRLKVQADLADLRSRMIVLKGRKRGSYDIEWVYDPDGAFCYIQVIDPHRPWHVGSSQRQRTKYVDLNLLRRESAYNPRRRDRRGYKRLLRCLREILFEDEGVRFSRKRCDDFFSDRSNFG